MTNYLPVPLPGTVTIPSAAGAIFSTIGLRNRVALLGDSIISGGLNKTSIATTAGTVVVSGGILSLSTGGNHTLAPGDYFEFWNVGDDPNYTLGMNGSMLQVATTPSSTTLTANVSSIAGAPVTLDGDYSNVYGQNWFFQPLFSLSDCSVFNWFNWFSKSAYRVTADYAVWGATSAGLLNRISRVLYGPAFDTAVICAGANDVYFAQPATEAGFQAAAIAAFQNITSVASKLLAAGKSVIIITPPPCSTGATNQQLKNEAFLQLRSMLLKWNAKNVSPYVAVLDFVREVINGNDTNGNTLTNYAGIQIQHISSTGCLNAGANLAAQHSALITPYDPQPVSVLEDSATYAQADAPYPNILTNGLMNGTAGTVGTGYQAGSTMPTGWSAGNGATGTITVTGGVARTAIANTNSANWGKALTINATFSATGQGCTINSTSFLSSVVPGNWYEFGCTIKALATSSGVGNMQLNATLRTSTIVLDQIIGGQGNDANGQNLTSGQILEYNSYVWIPLGTSLATGLLQFILTSNAAGSCNLELTSAYFRQIDSPYS